MRLLICVCLGGLRRWLLQFQVHAEKIIHGDISCRNVLLDANYDVKIQTTLCMTPKKTMLASQSLHWEAPEALAGEVQHTSKTDAYSFASGSL